ncbi:caspase family protein [Flaviaesturariibacter terrae]
MNVAIVIAVSRYSNSANNLPASKTDGEIMHGILEETKKFDRILTIYNNESSSVTKELLSNFFVENKGQKVDELFFYYSGHGEFSNDEFYYILSDFDSKKKNQTSLQNSEIDDLIRTLNPQIVVKFIDACQSGTSYIKESDVLTKYFNETKKGFNKCYFLNSSLSDQSSYQDDKLSFFTHSFVQALKEHAGSEIRYKDIIDYILDDFNGNQEQTPFFVIQAELTEKFCSLTADLKAYLTRSGARGTDAQGEQKSSPTILQLVQANAKDYVDKDGALISLNFLRERISDLSLDKEIADLYDVTINFIEDTSLLEGSASIGRWIRDNANDFFAKPQYVEYFDPEDGEMHTNLTGYTLLVDDAPFKGAQIEISSKYPNLKSYKCNVAILISKKELTLFYSILQYLDKGWDGKTIGKEKIKWIYTNTKIAYTESISTGVASVVEFINNRIKSDISTQFGLKADEGKEDSLPF